jgi:formate dehydrogenase gamma subunit
VHGRALLGGNPNAANCVDCHGAHEMRRTYDPDSKVNKLHVADDCGKCHSDIKAEFDESVHGKALLKGNTDSPSCVNCHGEHNILHVNDPNAPVASKNVSKQVCEPCHSSLRLSEQYGFSATRAETFEDSYHGLALRGGSTSVANCASCHGVHNIKPSSDPTSTINKNNLAKTCGTCHPGAGTRFTIGKVHVTYSDAEEEPILYWLAQIYTILIIVIIGGMLLHNILDFRKKAKHKLAIRRGEHPAPYRSHRLYLRMTVNERIQHLSLLISFFLLVITGFMLRFPDAWWVVMIRDLSESAFELRSLLHRIAGVVMAAASIYHLIYVIGTPRGRKLIIDLFPRIQDAKDAVAVLKYNLGMSNIKPRFGRFSYIEKSEYWALVWGNIVMISTGLIMWFDNYFMNLFTKLGWDIARTVHYYEAWLAFLAILVWHIYFVIFNPEAYPMNLAWLRGTLSEEEMAEEHPLELEKLRGTEDEIIPLYESDHDTETKHG